MKSKLYNKNGIALAWVMITLFVSAIFLVAIQSIVLSYFNRSNTEMDKRQAYLTARSACDAVASVLMSDDIVLNYIIDELENEGDFIEITDFNISDNKMGTVSSKIRKNQKNNKSYSIISTATVGNHVETVSLRMLRKENITTPSDLNGVYFNSTKFHLGKSIFTDGNVYLAGNITKDRMHILNVGGDVSILPNTTFESEISITTQKDIYIPSDKYNLQKATISSNLFSLSGDIYVGERPEIKALPAIATIPKPSWIKENGETMHPGQGNSYTPLIPGTTYILDKSRRYSKENMDVLFSHPDLSPTNPIYFIVNPNVVSEFQGEFPNIDGMPLTYFTLKNDASLHVVDRSHLAVYGEIGSDLILTGSGGTTVNIHGQFILNQVSCNLETVSGGLNFAPCLSSSSGESGDGFSWSKLKYEDGE